LIFVKNSGYYRSIKGWL